MALLRAILLLHYKGAGREGEDEKEEGSRRRKRGKKEEKGKEVDTVDLVGHRDNPTQSVTGRKGEGCMAMVCATVIMRRSGERQQQWQQ